MMEFTSPGPALDAIGFGRFQWLLLCFSGLGWFADACEVMLLSFLGPSARCQWGISAGSESTLSSVVFAGMLLGASSLGWLADAMGRRRGFLASALLMGASGLASALAPSFLWLLALRAVVGFALGGTPTVVTLFAEFVPSAQRGRWLLLMQSWWTLGTMFEAVLAWAVLPHLGWRWLLALSATPLLLLLLLYPWLPESPHWLVVQGRYAEAEAVVLRVAATNRYARQLRLNFGGQPHEGLDGGPAAGAGAGGWLHVGEAQQGGGAMLGEEEKGWEDGSNGTTAAEGGWEAHLSPREDPSAGSRAAEWLQQAAAAAGHQHQHQQQPERRGRRRLALPGGGGDDGSGLQGDGAEAGSLRTGSSAASSGSRATLLRARRALARLRAAFGQLLGPRLRRTTLLLYGIWSVNALTYYGLVLLTTALQTAKKAEECTPQGRPNLSTSDYTAILITTMAEAPGLLAAAFVVDWCGRRWSLRGLLACCSACALLLAAGPPSSAYQLFFLFVARAGIEGSFCLLYVYTPELYPTAVRAFGLALCNCFSRIGGFLAPYATVYLVEGGDSQASELLLGVLCAAAAAAAFFLPIETQGTDLHEHDDHPDAIHPTGWVGPGSGGGSSPHGDNSGGGAAAATKRGAGGAGGAASRRAPGPGQQLERSSLEVEILTDGGGEGGSQAGSPPQPARREEGPAGAGIGERDPLLPLRPPALS